MRTQVGGAHFQIVPLKLREVLAVKVSPKELTTVIADGSHIFMFGSKT